jgi:hypothetical protein
LESVTTRYGWYGTSTHHEKEEEEANHQIVDVKLENVSKNNDDDSSFAA